MNYYERTIITTEIIIIILLNIDYYLVNSYNKQDNNTKTITS
jgi:hypothetical protein